MRSDMKTVVHTLPCRKRLLHIEAEGCIVNIRVGLTDADGRPVTSVEVLADQYSGDRWSLDGDDATSRRATGIRVRKVLDTDATA